MPNTSYTPVHMSKVSVCEGCPTSILVHIQPLHYLMHIYSTNFVLLFKMVDWTFDDALSPYKARLLYQHQSCKVQVASI